MLTQIKIYFGLFLGFIAGALSLPLVKDWVMPRITLAMNPLVAIGVQYLIAFGIFVLVFKLVSNSMAE